MPDQFKFKWWHEKLAKLLVWKAVNEAEDKWGEQKTEKWMVLITIGLATLATLFEMVSAEWAVIPASILAIVYTWFRSEVKKRKWEIQLEDKAIEGGDKNAELQMRVQALEAHMKHFGIPVPQLDIPKAIPVTSDGDETAS